MIESALAVPNQTGAGSRSIGRRAGRTYTWLVLPVEPADRWFAGMHFEKIIYEIQVRGIPQWLCLFAGTVHKLAGDHSHHQNFFFALRVAERYGQCSSGWLHAFEFLSSLSNADVTGYLPTWSRPHGTTGIHKFPAGDTRRS